MRVWRPKFNPSAAIAETADLCRRYLVREIYGDAYAAGFVFEQFAAQRITYVQSTRTTSEAVLFSFSDRPGQEAMGLWKEKRG